jgi:hypothetical protein
MPVMPCAAVQVPKHIKHDTHQTSSQLICAVLYNRSCFEAMVPIATMKTSHGVIISIVIDNI